MSILTGKRVVILGDENQQIVALESELQRYGVVLEVATCGTIKPTDLLAKHVDLVILNHLHDGEFCAELLNHLRTHHPYSVLPVLALVEDSEEKIHNALMLGAADYIKAGEPITSVISKMKLLFGEAETFSDRTNITISTEDITTIEHQKTIKVFFVEDDPLLRNLLMLRFEKSHFQYNYTVDAENALPKLLEFMPDVILLDIMLPNKSGLELLAEIRQDENIAHIPVIMFSNRDEQIDKQKAKELGASHYFVKATTDLSVLVKTIEGLV